jgi:hypothetical protein
MQADDDKQYLHPEIKPFEPLLSRSLKRQKKTFDIILRFSFSFFVLLGGRAVWELHAAGHPISWLVAWAAFFATLVTIGLSTGLRPKQRQPNENVPRRD